MRLASDFANDVNAPQSHSLLARFWAIFFTCNTEKKEKKKGKEGEKKGKEKEKERRRESSCATGKHVLNFYDAFSAH